MNQKGVMSTLILIGFLIAAAIGGGLYYFSKPKFQTQITGSAIDTENWRTYTNSKYNYTIKYPPEFNPPRDNNSDYIRFNNQINILVEPAEKAPCLGDCPTEKINSSENTKVGGLDALKISGIKEVSRVAGYSPPESFIRYEITHKNYRHILEVEELDDDKSYGNEDKYPADRTPGSVPTNILTVFNQMLGTFKLLDYLDETATLKTYTNTKYRF